MPNQSDEIVAVDPTGKVVAKLGDLNGVDKTGVPHGLLFPASPDFSKDGNFFYVSHWPLIFGCSCFRNRSTCNGTSRSRPILFRGSKFAFRLSDQEVATPIDDHGSARKCASPF